MSQNLWSRIRDAAERYRGRFRYEITRPRMSVAEINSRIVPGAGADVGAEKGFAAFWSAHLRSTPTELWTGAPTASDESLARVRNGVAVILGREVPVTPATDWHTEPFHGVRWPRRFVETLPYHRPGSDLVLLWHLNKMLFLLDHAAAFRATRDPRLARDAYALVDSWCAANPFLVGMNWLSPLEAGTRLVAWSMTFAALADADAPDDETCERITRSILQQADFLAGHFSEWPVPNNHLIGEAAMLCTFAAYWPLLKDAPEWMRRGESALVGEVERQILKDGFQYESSVNYHCYSLDFFLLYLHAKALRREPPHATVLRGVQAMAQALIALVSPAGRLPMIGDDSITQFLVLRGWTGLEAIGERGVSFEDLLLPSHARLLGATPWGRDLIALRAPRTNARSFADAGIDVVRDDSSHFVFTHGPQHRRLAANGHLHADAGSFELELNGWPIVIDAGTYLYGLDSAVRDHFRGVTGHSTLAIDGVEPMQSVHTFQWENVAVGEHLGFGVADGAAGIGCRRKLSGTGGAAFVHTRALLKIGETVLVADAVQPRGTAGSHRVAALFRTPAAPGSAVLEGTRVRLTDAGEFVRVFEVSGGGTPRVELIDDPKAPLAQFSRWYGDLQAGTTIRVSAEFESALAFVAVMRTPEVSVEFARIDASEVSCAVETHGRRRVVAIRFDPMSIVVSGRPLVGPGVRQVSSPATGSRSMDWLDELSRGRP